MFGNNALCRCARVVSFCPSLAMLYSLGAACGCSYTFSCISCSVHHTPTFVPHSCFVTDPSSPRCTFNYSVRLTSVRNFQPLLYESLASCSARLFSPSFRRFVSSVHLFFSSLLSMFLPLMLPFRVLCCLRFVIFLTFCLSQSRPLHAHAFTAANTRPS